MFNRHFGDCRAPKAKTGYYLLRENQLLSLVRQPEPCRSNPHEGTIVAEAPDRMWGTDATATFTEQEGPVTVFAAIDHCTAECVGIHVVKKATRYEALKPIRHDVSERFGSLSGGTATGLWLRHDHGSVYMSDDFQNEIRFLGIEPSPAFVRQPEGTGASSASSAPQRTVAVDPTISRSRCDAIRSHRLPRPLQQRVDCRPPELSNSCSRETGLHD